MTDKKPYMLRAIYDWLVDNNLTPQIIIAYPNFGWVSGVPKQYIEQEQLVLNISPTATRNLTIEKDYLYFDTRFAGQSCSVCVDVLAIVGIFAREDTNEGMFFDLDPLVKEGKKTAKAEEEKTQTKPSFKFVK